MKFSKKLLNLSISKSRDMSENLINVRKEFEPLIIRNITFDSKGLENTTMFRKKRHEILIIQNVKKLDEENLKQTENTYKGVKKEKYFNIKINSKMDSSKHPIKEFKNNESTIKKYNTIEVE